MMIRRALLAIFPAILLPPLSAAVAQAPDRAATEAIIHDYLLAHPEVIPEAMTVLEKRQQAATIKANRTTIETPFGYEVEGNPHGDVTLVEFFDYNCAFCRASVADVRRLLAEDTMLRVVYRELPVRGADSDAAALTSLAVAQNTPDWIKFHRAIYAFDEASAANVIKAGAASGIALPGDAALKTPALRNEINQNLDLAQQLKIGGTPSWVVGDVLIDGAVGYDALKSAIANARHALAH